ncbi:hypothetical protein [Paracoccus sp. (in: a-proteobacteria)]|uniref:hypothetical protein n=1 Tax=Paracoccus sp. TaxID=267 RepID=UPI0026DF0578|nr:hypothetical protein [Paracoccus sp. (in: a-proteobacteria)]MDO5646338.1 hypothetical protein [Paracoccus sp. (in: a-proteobacteria)]
MSGPGFANLRTFSRSGNKAGQSVDQVLKEVEGDAEYSSHVEQPKPPELIFGMTIDEVRQAHAALLAKRKTKVQVKGEIKERAIRKDRHTLAGCVMSYPVPREQVQSDHEEWKRYLEWRELNLKWLKKLWGGNLKSVIQHSDEPYLHLHAFGLPESDSGCDARTMNPAYMMKRRVLQEEKAAGKSNKEALKIAKRAYRSEGRNLQDDYHAIVGIPSGLTRYGPRRRRLTRAEWHTEKEIARASSDFSLIAEARETKKYCDRLESEADELVQRNLDLRWTFSKLKIERSKVAKALDDERNAVEAARIERREIVESGRQYSMKIIYDADEKAHNIIAAAEARSENAEKLMALAEEARLLQQNDAARREKELVARDQQLTARERHLEVVVDDIENAADNLGRAINLVAKKRILDVIKASDAGEAVFHHLTRASGKDHPTRLDWFRAASLRFLETGQARHLPESTIGAINTAFDRIGSWAARTAQLEADARAKGLEDARQEAAKIVESATKAASTHKQAAESGAVRILQEAELSAHKLVDAAKAEAIQIAQQATLSLEEAATLKTQAETALTSAEAEATRLVREEIQKRRMEPQASAWAAFAELLKEGVRAVFGNEGYQRLADWFRPRWQSHPANPERPVERRADWNRSSGPSP